MSTTLASTYLANVRDYFQQNTFQIRSNPGQWGLEYSIISLNLHSAATKIAIICIHYLWIDISRTIFGAFSRNSIQLIGLKTEHQRS